jgi:hypothetical protein
MLLDIATALGKARKALAGRHLFDNWFSLMIKYALHRLGFDVKLTAKIHGYTFEMSPETFEQLVSRSSRGLIKSIKCIDGRIFVNEVEVKNIDEVIYNLETWARVLGWAYDLKGYWIKDGVKFRRIYWSILEIFDNSEYKLLGVKDRVVVDVGAFVGDSPIYFALKGARKVIAIEPKPEAYEEMLENIKLNNLENIIVPINAYLISEQNKARFGEAPVVTLNDVVSKYIIDGNAVLKMDCEGCEFDIILNDYAHIKVFNEVIFEYHANVGGKSSKLLKRIVNDYQCKLVKKHGRDFGIIYCVRKR